MSSNTKYNYDYSSGGIISFNKQIAKKNIPLNQVDIKADNNNNSNNNNINSMNNMNQNHIYTSNRFRINNLEERISSLEKMLQYVNEFIHLKEQEKNSMENKLTNPLMDPLIIRINSLEKEIKDLKREKEEDKKIISELNNKISELETKINNNNSASSMRDVIYSLSDKEKKLNLLINDFSDISKETNKLIHKTVNEKINEFNIFNENRINELLVLIQDINKIIEENELKVNKFNQSVEKVLKDNLNIIKIISIQEQKFNTFELIVNEITDIKEKIRFFINEKDMDYSQLEENLKIDKF